MRRLIQRPARVPRWADHGPRTIQAPPTLTAGQPDGAPVALLPVAGTGAALALMAASRNALVLAAAAVLALASAIAGVAMAFSERARAARALRARRAAYLDHLDALRLLLDADERERRAAVLALDPPPEALYDVVRDPARLWARRRGDRDFLHVRVGSGTVPVPAPALQAGGRPGLADPLPLAEARALQRRFATAERMPLLVPLDRAGDVSVVGNRPDVLALARCLLVQVAALHAPDDVSLALACPPDRLGEWAWFKWLPHALDPARRDGPVEARRIAPRADQVAELLAADLVTRATLATDGQAGELLPRTIVVNDSHGAVATTLPLPDPSVAAADLGVTVVHLIAERIDEPDGVALRVTVAGAEVTVEDLRGATPALAGSADHAPPATAEGLARMLAPLRLAPEPGAGGPAGATLDLAGLLGIADPSDPDLDALWAPRSERDFMRAPFAADNLGRPLLLDLKEPSQGGMGPHGLCVGPAGSGKSELLRTLVLALVATHPPEQLNLVLVDAEGDGTFTPFEGLPHLAGAVAGLRDDAGLTERLHASLAGELKRRQRVVHDPAGQAPLTHLLVVVDEPGPLLAAHPGFAELLATIGRLGRGLSVHLLLATEQVDGGLERLATSLSYRLGLGPPPGAGYLKVGSLAAERFTAASVSAPRATAPAEAGGPVPYTAFNSTPEPARLPAARPGSAGGPGLLDVLTARLREAGRPAQPIWLPPLPRALTLDAVGGRVGAARRGLQFASRPGPMLVPAGLLDDPGRQWQGRWLLDLGGHVAVAGGPGSGRTTLLQTLVCALALTHTPREVAVYGVDLAADGLRPLAALPHVGGVAAAGDGELRRRTVAEVRGMLDVRERLLAEHGVDSVEALRRHHAEGGLPELPAADVVLVVDGLGLLRAGHDELHAQVAELLQRGDRCGLHVLASMERPDEVPSALQARFGTRIELRLGDPAESALDPRLAATVRGDQAGRALTAERLFAQVALPRIDGHSGTGDLGEAVAQLGEAAAEAWPGDPVPGVRVLPALVRAGSLPGPLEEPRRVPIGLDEASMGPLCLDLFDLDRNLLVLGERGCGKTNLLRLVARGLTARFASTELVFGVIDPRGGLRDLVAEAYLGGYATTVAASASLAEGIATELARRRLERAERGPRVVILVDDYDRLTAAGQQPLQAFLAHLPSAWEAGLHFVAARRTAGAARALQEPFLAALQASGTSGLVMSGDPAEGPLLAGVHATRLPAGRGLWLRRGQPDRLVQTAAPDPLAESVQP